MGWQCRHYMSVARTRRPYAHCPASVILLIHSLARSFRLTLPVLPPPSPSFLSFHDSGLPSLFLHPPSLLPPLPHQALPSVPTNWK
jgi:hypothetical protein